VLDRDRREAPREIAALRSRLQNEDDPAVRQQLEQAVVSKEEQLANLHKLENVMEKAEYQLETTLTALGTVYSQLLLISAKDIDSGRAQRLRDDIAAQVANLQSLQETLDEVYGSSAR
jgi:mannose/cellobiose epimerase-like protein (N-acyl-D-glucosamine 2-epimerase family)